MRVLVVVALLAVGCFKADLVECGDGRACPVGTVCASLIATDAPLCVHGDQLAACASAAELDDCATGACYASTAGLVCMPSGCGNAIVDRDEVCDDGNAATGDGCAPTCLSNETCGNGVVDPATEQCDDGDHIGHDGCASDCSDEVAQLDLVRYTPPVPLSGTSLAYDSGRDRIVLFGGVFQPSATSLPVARDATYEWDGSGWSSVPSTIAPSKRAGAAIAYDAERRRIVVFGGSPNGGSVFGDTWEYDGATWTLRAPTTAPPPRAFANAVYDHARRRVVMFGGVAGVALDDTWEWDGTNWSQVQLATHPVARGYHVMVYDPVRSVVVLAGGSGSPAGTAYDTWEYDGVAWRSVSTAPAEMISSAAVYDGTRIVAVGGFSGGATLSIMWEYTGGIWTPISPAGLPSARYMAAFVMDPVRGRALLFGGRTQTTGPTSIGTLGDMYEWNGTTWTIPATVVPAARTLHAAAYDTKRGRMIVFGGSATAAGTSPFGDTQELVGGHWLTTTTTGPSARAGSAMAYDVARDVTVLFGGYSGTREADTWRYDGASWTPASVSGPSPRYLTAMAYDVRRKVMVLFGGFTASTPSADTWLWDGVSWQPQTPSTQPPPRYGHAMVYDPLRERVVMFGGYGVMTGTLAPLLDDAWEWDGATWIRIVSTSKPPARMSAALGYHPLRRTLAVYGGAAGSFVPFADTWELAGNVWSQQPIANAPAEHQGHSIVQLADGSGLASFGGGPFDASNDMLRLRWTNGHRHELCTLDADEDGDGLSGCADPDCWARCTPLCPPGAPCDPAAPRCGDGVCNSALEGCHLCPGDCTCTPVCGDNFCDPGETATSCKGDCS